ncbi:MAG: DUF1800 domain-containing protein [Dehalococcoidia bacterium]|nr:DUF1800 domain-containing protein [Dehalococcoidia bacterium]
MSNEHQLIAHLMRRAGFGGNRLQLDAYAAKGYQATVDELLDFAEPQSMADDLIRRYHPDQSAGFESGGAGSSWLYRLVSTNDPLREKMTLFWHGIFATGYAKVTVGKVLTDQIRMFRNLGMGSFKSLLLELSKNPAMIIWLDNVDNHNGAINENYGRELLELFSLGVGNYTEEDVKEASRAFTGWTVANTEYTKQLAVRNSIWPYGKIAWRYEYHSEDHDDGEKTFLGETGRFNGEDILDIICRQPATARFIARHMYHFFVADEPPVPQWPYESPRDPEAIEMLAQAYFDSDYDIRSMLRVLFNSDFFQSEERRYGKVKSPVELVTGVIRLTEEFDGPSIEIGDRNSQMSFMGQQLLNPPSVEGWHQGVEWIETGSLIERLNFAAQQLGDLEKPGVKSMVRNILQDESGPISAERLVDKCLDQLGAIEVSPDTKSALVRFASSQSFESRSADSSDETQKNVSDLLRLVASVPEFQRT